MAATVKRSSAMPIAARMRRWSDAKLDKELAFARGFNFSDRAGRKWHQALHYENGRRAARAILRSLGVK